MNRRTVRPIAPLPRRRVIGPPRPMMGPPMMGPPMMGPPMMSLRVVGPPMMGPRVVGRPGPPRRRRF